MGRVDNKKESDKVTNVVTSELGLRLDHKNLERLGVMKPLLSDHHSPLAGEPE